MEAKGLNVFSLRPDTHHIAVDNKTAPSVYIYRSADSLSKPDFFEVFSQLTIPSLNKADIEDGPEFTLPLTPNDTVDKLAIDIPIDFFSIDPSGIPFLSLSPAVLKSDEGQVLPEFKPEAVYSQGGLAQPNPASREDVLQRPYPGIDTKALPVSEIKVSEVTEKRPAEKALIPHSLSKTAKPELSGVTELSQRQALNYRKLPVIEAYSDKTIAQNMQLAQIPASEILPSVRAVERKINSPISQSGIPLPASSVETPPVVASVKPLITETGLPAKIKESASMLEVPISRLGQNLIQMISKGEQKLEFRLDPPELGKLTMTVVMERDSVSVQMLTSSQGVRDLLLMQAERLRMALADESITLGQMTVDIGGQNAHNQKHSATSETLLLADFGSESGKYQTASITFKAQGGRLLDYFV